MVSRERHQKNEIAGALRRAQDAGLVVAEMRNGHRWGTVSCESCGADRQVFSTPQNAGAHAKQIDRFTAKHAHPR